jgi:hypothetical protein
MRGLRAVLVALNRGAEQYSLPIDSLGAEGQILFSTYLIWFEAMSGDEQHRPDEGVIMSLSALKDPLPS